MLILTRKSFDRYLNEIKSFSKMKDVTISPSYFGLFTKTHFEFVSLLERLNVTLDEADLNRMTSIFLESSKKRLPIETIKNLLVSAIYSTQIRNEALENEILGVFKKSEMDFQKFMEFISFPNDKINIRQFCAALETTMSPLLSSEYYSEGIGNSLVSFSKQRLEAIYVLADSYKDVDRMQVPPLNAYIELKSLIKEALSNDLHMADWRYLSENELLQNNFLLCHLIKIESGNISVLVSQMTRDLVSLMQQIMSHFISKSHRKLAEKILICGVPWKSNTAFSIFDGTLDQMVLVLKEKMTILKEIMMNETCQILPSGLFDVRFLAKCLQYQHSLQTGTPINQVNMICQIMNQKSQERTSNPLQIEWKDVEIINGTLNDGMISQNSSIDNPKVPLTVTAKSSLSISRPGKTAFHPPVSVATVSMVPIPITVDAITFEEGCDLLVKAPASPSKIPSFGMHLAPTEWQQTSPSSKRQSVLENFQTFNLIDNYCTIYVSSTPDARNERKRIFEDELPILKRAFALKGIFIDVVDLKCTNSVCTVEEYRSASSNLIKRASLHIFVIGGSLKSDKILDQNGLPGSTLQIEMDLISALSKRRPIVFFRDNSFVRAVPKSYRHRFESEEIKDLEFLMDAKEALTLNNPHIYTYPCTFSHIEGNELVLDDLDVFGRGFSEQIQFQLVEMGMEASEKYEFLWTKSRIFARKRLISFLDPDASRVCSDQAFSNVFIIKGQNGCGKSSLLSQMKNVQKDSFLILDNFVRTWSGSFDTTRMIQKFCNILSRFMNGQFASPFESHDDLWSQYLDLISRVTFMGQRVLILIDGVDRLTTRRDSQIRWLPKLSELNNEVWKNVFWIISVNSESNITDELDKRRMSYHNLELHPLSKEEAREHLMQLLPHTSDEQKAAILSKRDINNFIYMHLLVNQLKPLESKHLLTEISSMPETIEAFLNDQLSKLENKYGQRLFSSAMSLLCVARNGVSEPEMIDLLGINSLEWISLYQGIQHFTKFSRSGQLILLHAEFTRLVRLRYLADLNKVNEFHEMLGRYFLSQSDPLMNGSWVCNYLGRAADTMYHLFSSAAPLEIVVKALCSLPFLETMFANRADHELSKFFTSAIKLAIMKEDKDSRQRINDYTFFIERFSSTFRKYPDLMLPLALSLPKTSCISVKRDAMLNGINGRSFVKCLTQIEDRLDVIPMGAHSAKIIYITVIQLRSHGKCCVSVSDDGATKAWDIDSFLHLDVILEAPFSNHQVVQCAFNLGVVDRVAFADLTHHLNLFCLQSKILLTRIDNAHYGGTLFFSKSPWGLWQKGHDASLQYTAFNESKQGQLLESISSLDSVNSGSDLNTRIFIDQCDSILAKSNDGTKIALYAKKHGGALIINASTMSKVCMFRDEGITASSFGQFSVSRDMIALTLKSGDIMIWKIDNHSRVALIKSSHIKLRSIAFSADELMIYCGDDAGGITSFGIQNGLSVKNTALGNHQHLDLLCSSTSYGKERFFLSSGASIMMCDLKLILDSEADKGASLNSRNDQSGSLICFSSWSPSQTLDSCHAISFSNRGELSIWEREKVIKQLKIDNATTAFNCCDYDVKSELLVYSTSKHIVVYSLRSNAEVQRKPIVKHIREIKVQRMVHKGLPYIWIGALTSTDSLCCWSFFKNESNESWNMNLLFEKSGVSRLPKQAIQSDTDKLLTCIFGNVCVLNAWTGKQIFQMETEDGAEIRDMSWIYQRNPIRMADQIAVMTSDIIYVGGSVWSSALPGDTVPVYLDTFGFDRFGDYLVYTGEKHIQKMDHKAQNLRTITKGLVHVIQTKPSRKRVAILDHGLSRVRYWKFSFDMRLLITAASDGLIRVWNMPKDNSRTISNSGLLGDSMTRTPTTVFPLEFVATMLEVSDRDYLIYVGNGSKIVTLEFIPGLSLEYQKTR